MGWIAKLCQIAVVTRIYWGFQRWSIRRSFTHATSRKQPIPFKSISWWNRFIWFNVSPFTLLLLSNTVIISRNKLAPTTEKPRKKSPTTKKARSKHNSSNTDEESTSSAPRKSKSKPKSSPVPAPVDDGEDLMIFTNSPKTQAKKAETQKKKAAEKSAEKEKAWDDDAWQILNQWTKNTKLLSSFLSAP